VTPESSFALETPTFGGEEIPYLIVREALGQARICRSRLDRFAPSTQNFIGISHDQDKRASGRISASVCDPVGMRGRFSTRGLPHTCERDTAKSNSSNVLRHRRASSGDISFGFRQSERSCEIAAARAVPHRATGNQDTAAQTRLPVAFAAPRSCGPGGVEAGLPARSNIRAWLRTKSWGLRQALGRRVAEPVIGAEIVVEPIVVPERQNPE